MKQIEERTKIDKSTDAVIRRSKPAALCGTRRHMAAHAKNGKKGVGKGKKGVGKSVP